MYRISLAAVTALATLLFAAASAQAYNGCWHRIDNSPGHSEVKFSCPKDAPGNAYSATLVYRTPSGERRTLKSVASPQGEPSIGVIPRSRGTYVNVIDWTYLYW